MIIDKRINFFETQIDVMRNCVERKQIWQKESHKPVAVVEQPIPTPHPLGDDFGSDLPLLFKLHEIWLIAFLENRAC